MKTLSRKGVTYCLNHLGWCWQSLANIQTMRCGWFVSQVSTVPCSGSDQQHSSWRCSEALKQRLVCTQNLPDAFPFIVLTPSTFFPFLSRRPHLWPKHYHVSVAHIHCSTATALILLLQRMPELLGKPMVFLQDTAIAACSETHWFVPSSVAVSCTAMNRHH